jgi:hypothetical protein
LADPTSGPFVSSEYLNGPPTSLGYIPRHFQRDRKWYRQTKPYDRALEFDFSQRRVDLFSHELSHLGTVTSDYADVGSIPASFADDPVLYAKAYSEFREKVGAAAELGAAIAQSQKAIDMIEKRVKQVYELAMTLKKGRLLKITKRGRLIRHQAVPFDARKSAKEMGGTVLEVLYGWLPMMGDIYSATEVLSREIRPKAMYARKKTVEHFPTNVSSSDGINRWDHTQTDRFEQHITIRAFIEIQNPNLDLVNRLGLINPATILWEVIPFSFIVDWFVNVQEVLGSLTDFEGAILKNPHRTTFTKWRRSRREYTDYNYNSPVWSGPPSYFPFQRYTGTKTWLYSGVYCRRVVGSIPGPSLVLRGGNPLSPSRALASVALLLQQLS